MILPFLLAALLAASSLPTPEEPTTYVDLTKAVSIADYDTECLLFVMDKSHYIVVRKDMVALVDGKPSVATESIRMTMILGGGPGEPAPIILAFGPWIDKDGAPHSFTLNCSTYTSMKVCEDAYDAAVASLKRRYPKPPAKTGTEKP